MYIKALLGRFQSRIFGPPIVAGQVFEFRSRSSNPFASPPHKVEVIAVKDGWVSYRFCVSMMWMSNSMKIASFRCCYKLKREEPK